ncbi:Glutathione transport system permease protein GsiD [subsurface metagenome]
MHRGKNQKVLKSTESVRNRNRKRDGGTMSNREVTKIRQNSPMKDIWRRLKKNKLALLGLATLLIIFVMAVFAPLIIPYDYAAQNYEHRLEFPSRDHWLGTDNFGRDIFSRIVYGSRYTLVIGFGCITVSAIIGSILGALAGFFPAFDNIIMRFTDVVMAIPIFTLNISIIAALGKGIENMMIAMTITNIPMFIRIVRARVMTIREQEFIEAARAIGASDFRILVKHIMFNSLAPIIIQFTLGAGTIILWAASLSFIGLGVQPPTPEWGLMISAGRTYLRDYWYISIFPGLAIVMITYALNLLGDGLRDAMDPRLK